VWERTRHESLTSCKQYVATINIEEGYPDAITHKAFKSTADQLHLDEDERAFLAQCVAPFSKRTTIQAPFGTESQTVTGHPVTMLTVSRPETIDEETPWGFHIFTNPQITADLNGYENASGISSQLRTFKTQGALILDGGFSMSGFSKMNGAVVMIITFKESELPLTIETMVTLPADRFTPVTDPDLYDRLVPSALTALSYKVVNESPALAKQGNVIDYLQDAQPAVSQLISKFEFTGGSGTTIDLYGVPCQTLVCPAPPSSQQEIAPLRSVTRNASEGSLVVQRFMYSLKTLVTPDESGWAYGSRSQDTQNMPHNGHQYIGGRGNISVRTPSQPIPSNPMNEMVVVKQAETRHGSFYTGQAADSTFTVTIHMVIERAPEAGSQIMQYASVPPARSELALRAASVASKLLPVGAPASHNSLGSLLSTVMRGVSKVFSPAMRVAHYARNIPGPLGAAAGVVEDVGEFLGKRQGRRHEERQQQHTDTRAPRAAPRVEVKRKGRTETIKVRVPKKGQRKFRPVRRR